MSNNNSPEMRAAELEEELKKYKYALADMVNQFAYGEEHKPWTSLEETGLTQIYTGGLSALEDAFEVLGLEDPCLRKDVWNIMNKEEENDTNTPSLQQRN